METIVTGHVEVICGCMFSGKSEELIRRVRRAIIAKQRVQVFRPCIDTRGHSRRVASHSKMEVDAEPLPTDNPWAALTAVSPDTQVVAFDEAQFFSPALVEVVEQLATYGKRVIVAGLDLDYKGLPFGSMPDLLARAEQVDKLTAICTECGEPATRTQRLTESHEQVEIGAAEKYAARCRRHFTPPS